MIVGLLSDTHDHLPLIDEAIKKLNEMKVELVLHAGDYISPFVATHFKQLKAPLILDLSHLDFLGVAGFRALLALDDEHRRDEVVCQLVIGAAVHRLMRVVTDHPLPVVESVPEALQRIEEAI